MSMRYPFIAVDWGTSRMRAMLCKGVDMDFRDVPTVTGPGIGKLDRRPAEVLFPAIAEWTLEHGNVDILICGMAGSAAGWYETPYAPCPVDPADLANELVLFEEQDHRIAIVPGVSCTNWMGQPDVMRGEEVQVLGLMSSTSGVSEQELVCLPGTHTKWVKVHGSSIQSFTTSVTGELFDLLKKHSILVSRAVDPTVFSDQAFRQGLDTASRNSDRLLHAIFSTRSRVLQGLANTADASSYLSGLLIGADVKLGASAGSNTEVLLVGDVELCELYKKALEHFGYGSAVMNGNDASLAGLLAIAEASR